MASIQMQPNIVAAGNEGENMFLPKLLTLNASSSSSLPLMPKSTIVSSQPMQVMPPPPPQQPAHDSDTEDTASNANFNNDNVPVSTSTGPGLPQGDKSLVMPIKHMIDQTPTEQMSNIEMATVSHIKGTFDAYCEYVEENTKLLKLQYSLFSKRKRAIQRLLVRGLLSANVTKLSRHGKVFEIKPKPRPKNVSIKDIATFMERSQRIDKTRISSILKELDRFTNGLYTEKQHNNRINDELEKNFTVKFKLPKSKKTMTME